MRRLASQPRNVRYGIPRRMRAQYPTRMTVHVRKLNRGMKQSINQSTTSKTTKAGPRGGISKRIQEILIQFKSKFKSN